jgi:hypothetical protein
LQTVRKKRAAVSGGFEVDNREASNRVDRSHSVSKKDDSSHKRESLIGRKRAILFSIRLPCRPLADTGLKNTLRLAPIASFRI